MSTKIEWTQETWNPFTGCDKISPACDNCYAERFANRLQNIPSSAYKYRNGFKPTFHPDELKKPMHWIKPRKIFVVSMGDMFHQQNSWDDIREVIDITLQCPQHTFIMLTKRAQIMHDFFSWLECMGYQLPLANVWLGVTVENQQYLLKRVPILLQIPAVIKFVSLEPLLEDINFEINIEDMSGNLLDSVKYPDYTGIGSFSGLDWVICGGETGHNSRKLNPSWVTNILRQCQNKQVPFFFKSWGDWKCSYKIEFGNTIEHIGFVWDKVGKKHTGCEIGNQIYQQYPGENNITNFNIIYKH